MGNRMVSGLNSITSSARRGLTRTWHELSIWIAKTIGPTLQRWWSNPLLHAARSESPISWRVLSRIIAAAASVMMVLAIAAWIISERTLGAVLLALSLGIVLLTLATCSFQGVASAATQFKRTSDNPRQMLTADPAELVWGMALVAMWRLRWLVALCLAMTPTLMVSVLHVDVSTFINYRDSVIALGSAAPLDQVRLLGPGVSIPYFRLVLRALSIGVVPYALMPLLAALGVTTTLILRDRMLSLTLGLIASVTVLLIFGTIGQFLSSTYLLGHRLEFARLILMVAYLIGIGVLIWRVNILNADLLVNIPPDEGII